MAKSKRFSRARVINPNFVVFCEGPTEENYIYLLRDHFKIPTIKVKTFKKGENIDLRYVEIKLEELYFDRSIDKIFLFYDLDKPTTLGKINRLHSRLKKEGYKSYTLFTNPCIEFWFLLHLKDQNAFIDCKKCNKILEKRFKYKKPKLCNPLKELLLDKLETASHRARKLSKDYSPNSSVYYFTDELISLQNRKNKI